ncbi:hypothetical protein TRFO_39888 [Tritrichomonas foetus]|uniref:Uncharacterized protein n=1 Tax=Tritrichomonas foetus TaxID=1144522 RepID=A0A1J4J6X1_9EUKA|nr:hypothetical protein TRFO_39888 [Tritrichomonas foetus]|eukprot:OHS93935.1 hypothetical protein TRFO_39888 [Tritrichomonas foetus]
MTRKRGGAELLEFPSLSPPGGFNDPFFSFDNTSGSQNNQFDNSDFFLSRHQNGPQFLSPGASLRKATSRKLSEILRPDLPQSLNESLEDDKKKKKKSKKKGDDEKNTENDTTPRNSKKGVKPSKKSNEVDQPNSIDDEVKSSKKHKLLKLGKKSEKKEKNEDEVVSSNDTNKSPKKSRKKPKDDKKNNDDNEIAKHNSKSPKKEKIDKNENEMIHQSTSKNDSSVDNIPIPNYNIPDDVGIPAPNSKHNKIIPPQKISSNEEKSDEGYQSLPPSKHKNLIPRVTTTGQDTNAIPNYISKNDPLIPVQLNSPPRSHHQIIPPQSMDIDRDKSNMRINRSSVTLSLSSSQKQSTQSIFEVNRRKLAESKSKDFVIHPSNNANSELPLPRTRSNTNSPTKFEQHKNNEYNNGDESFANPIEIKNTNLVNKNMFEKTNNELQNNSKEIKETEKGKDFKINQMPENDKINHKNKNHDKNNEKQEKKKKKHKKGKINKDEINDKNEKSEDEVKIESNDSNKSKKKKKKDKKESKNKKKSKTEKMRKGSESSNKSEKIGNIENKDKEISNESFKSKSASSVQKNEKITINDGNNELNLNNDKKKKKKEERKEKEKGRKKSKTKKKKERKKSKSQKEPLDDDTIEENYQDSDENYKEGEENYQENESENENKKNEEIASIENHYNDNDKKKHKKHHKKHLKLHKHHKHDHKKSEKSDKSTKLNKSDKSNKKPEEIEKSYVSTPTSDSKYAQKDIASPSELLTNSQQNISPVSFDQNNIDDFEEESSSTTTTTTDENGDNDAYQETTFIRKEIEDENENDDDQKKSSYNPLIVQPMPAVHSSSSSSSDEEDAITIPIFDSMSSFKPKILNRPKQENTDKLKSQKLFQPPSPKPGTKITFKLDQINNKPILNPATEQLPKISSLIDRNNSIDSNPINSSMSDSIVNNNSLSNPNIQFINGNNDSFESNFDNQKEMASSLPFPSIKNSGFEPINQTQKQSDTDAFPSLIRDSLTKRQVIPLPQKENIKTSFDIKNAQPEAPNKDDDDLSDSSSTSSTTTSTTPDLEIPEPSITPTNTITANDDSTQKERRPPPIPRIPKDNKLNLPHPNMKNDDSKNHSSNNENDATIQSTNNTFSNLKRQPSPNPAEQMHIEMTRNLNIELKNDRNTLSAATFSLSKPQNNVNLNDQNSSNSTNSSATSLLKNNPSNNNSNPTSISQNSKKPPIPPKPSSHKNEKNLNTANISSISHIPTKIQARQNESKNRQRFPTFIKMKKIDFNTAVQAEDIDQYMNAAYSQLVTTFASAKVDDRNLEMMKYNLTEKANHAEKDYEALNANMEGLERKMENAKELFDKTQANVEKSHEKVLLVERKLTKLSTKYGNEGETKTKITNFALLMLINLCTFLLWFCVLAKRFTMSFYTKSDNLPKVLTLKEAGRKVEETRKQLEESKKIEELNHVE